MRGWSCADVPAPEAVIHPPELPAQPAGTVPGSIEPPGRRLPSTNPASTIAQNESIAGCCLSPSDSIEDSDSLSLLPCVSSAAALQKLGFFCGFGRSETKPLGTPRWKMSINYKARDGGLVWAQEAQLQGSWHAGPV